MYFRTKLKVDYNQFKNCLEYLESCTFASLLFCYVLPFYWESLQVWLHEKYMKDDNNTRCKVRKQHFEEHKWTHFKLHLYLSVSDEKIRRRLDSYWISFAWIHFTKITYKYNDFLNVSFFWGLSHLSFRDFQSCCRSMLFN